jgi:LysW-gamma-L-lysine/LysW-L-ornithine aminotransferase
VLVRGEGARVWDDTGKEYIDCVAGHGVANVGHCNDKVVAAVSEQAQRLISCPGVFYNDMKARLLEKLVGVTPASVTRAFLCNSGTEAIEAAIKFARFSTKKQELVCAMRGFHGRTMGALSATFTREYRDPFAPIVEGFQYAPFNNFAKFEEKVNDNTAAILLEVVQGEGGVHLGRAEFFGRIQDLCKKQGILLVIDEVQTGFCRTGKMFASEHFDLEPDILCVAKAMAGGLPMGAVLCSDRVEAPVGKHGSTFGGNPLVCAASLAAMDYMVENQLHEQARDKGAHFVTRLSGHELPKVREIRQMGLMIGVELKEKGQPYLVELMERGVLALPAGATVVRFLPPLTITQEELDRVADTLVDVLNA